MLLDGGEAPVRIDARALLSSEELAPAAVLNKVKFCPFRLGAFCICLYHIVVLGLFCSNFYVAVLNKVKSLPITVCLSFVLQIRAPYRPIDSKMSTLSKDRDELPSGKQTLALTLTWVLHLLLLLLLQLNVPQLRWRLILVLLLLQLQV